MGISERGPAGARALVRAELTRQILEGAREELAVSGPAALSLRAVARRTGMAPSALYRYYESRDHLLTALIIDAYQALAGVAQRADRRAGEGLGDRWFAVGRALRARSRRQPHEWSLVFGTPVPGYAGNEETSAAALELHGVALDIIRSAHREGRIRGISPATERLAASVAPIVDLVAVPPEVAAAGVNAWGHVLGHISLECFGHLHGVVTDADIWFDHVLLLSAGLMGLS